MANTNNGNGNGAPVVRCAIYTRKSTDEGLKQDFNSLDAQRDAGAAYIRSQAGEGWTLLPEQYDDGGYTGANMDRPGLRRLLADVQAKKVDCVVVYKVDRLSRSIRDFGKIMEILEKHRVVACKYRQSSEKSLTGKTAGHIPNDSDDFGRSDSLSGVCIRHLRKALAEDPTRATPIPATHTSDGGTNLHRNSLPRQILKTAAIAAMDGVRDAGANRTLWTLLDVNEQPEAVCISLDTIQN